MIRDWTLHGEVLVNVGGVKRSCFHHLRTFCLFGVQEAIFSVTLELEVELGSFISIVQHRKWLMSSETKIIETWCQSEVT